MAKAGVISIDVNAGTAQFLVDMDKANVKLQQFGRGAQESGAHVVSSMQSSSAAIRLLENPLGNNMRAAERFLSMIPGVGAALQVAFPIIGAIALYDAFNRAISRTEELKTALKELQAQAEATDKADLGLVAMLDKLGAASIGRQLGPAAQAGAEATRLKMEAQDAGTQILGLESKIRGLRLSIKDNDRWVLGGPSQKEVDAQIATAEEQINQLLDKQQGLYAEAGQAASEAGQKASQQTGQLAAKRITAAEESSKQLAEISKQQYDSEIERAHAAEVQRIAGIVSEYSKTVQLGQEEIRFAKAKQDEINGYALASRDRLIGTRGNNGEIAAKAGAESAGKDKPEQDLIQAGAQADTQKAKNDYSLATGKTALDTQKAQADAALKLIDLNQKVAATLANDVREGWDKVSEAAKKTQAATDEAAEKQIVALQRVAEIQDKSAGEQAALKIKAQQIALEGQYGSILAHTLGQQITYMQQIAQLEHDERESEIDGVKKQLADAEALDEQVRDLVKIADLKAEIAKLTSQDANANAQASANVGNTQKNGGAAAQFGQTVQGGVSSLSNALAQGIMNGGKGLGKDIRNSLKGIGKEMLGDVIKQSVEGLIVAITGQTIATNAQTVATWALEIVEDIQALFGFADGGKPAPGVPYVVGENGPEIRIDDGPGTIIPNHMIGSAGSRSIGSGVAKPGNSPSQGGHVFNQTNHIYESDDAPETGRQITNYMKSMIPSAAAYSS